VEPGKTRNRARIPRTARPPDVQSPFFDFSHSPDGKAGTLFPEHAPGQQPGESPMWQGMFKMDRGDRKFVRFGRFLFCKREDRIREETKKCRSSVE
jgi:hypothetical protein